MSTYAIGDIQGCYSSLQNLLEKIAFDPAKDTLWVAGDMVNRGPDSLNSLRLIKNLGSAAHCVLGNHDLHLLAIYAGERKPKKSDTLNDILEADDCDELLHWLRHQPLLFHPSDSRYVMVHAGIPPIWNLSDAKCYAREVEAILQSDTYPDFLMHMYGNEPNTWDNTIHGMERLRLITNYLTRMRFCKAQGELELKTKTGLTNIPAGYDPWFSFHQHRLTTENSNIKVIFGHWAALMGQTNHSQFIALDTGCIWGEKLTAMRLDDEHFFSVSCRSFT